MKKIITAIVWAIVGIIVAILGWTFLPGITKWIGPVIGVAVILLAAIWLWGEAKPVSKTVKVEEPIANPVKAEREEAVVPASTVPTRKIDVKCIRSFAELRAAKDEANDRLIKAEELFEDAEDFDDEVGVVENELQRKLDAARARRRK